MTKTPTLQSILKFKVQMLSSIYNISVFRKTIIESGWRLGWHAWMRSIYV
jgi:hypothetical protein